MNIYKRKNRAYSMQKQWNMVLNDRYTHNVFGIRLAVRYIQSLCGVSPLVPLELIKEIAESL